MLVRRTGRRRVNGAAPAVLFPGRWSGHLSYRARAGAVGVSRTAVFMATWIMRHAPDVVPEIEDDRMKLTPTYKRLRAEYLAGVARALDAPEGGEGCGLASIRRDGRFVFRWVTREPEKPAGKKLGGREEDMTCPASRAPEPDPQLIDLLNAAHLGTGTGAVGLLLAAAARLMPPPPATEDGPQTPRPAAAGKGRRKGRRKK